MGSKATSNRLDNKGRVRLLRSWLHYFYEVTENWSDQEIGMHIAYLCKAVIHNDKVEWTDDNPALLLILKKDPKRLAVIWRFISIVSHDR